MPSVGITSVVPVNCFVTTILGVGFSVGLVVDLTEGVVVSHERPYAENNKFVCV